MGAWQDCGGLAGLEKLLTTQGKTGIWEKQEKAFSPEVDVHMTSLCSTSLMDKHSLGLCYCWNRT